MKAVAAMVGFSSAEQMRRAWQQFEGTIPTKGKRSVKATKAEEVE